MWAWKIWDKRVYEENYPRETAFNSYSTAPDPVIFSCFIKYVTPNMKTCDWSSTPIMVYSKIIIWIFNTFCRTFYNLFNSGFILPLSQLIHKDGFLRLYSTKKIICELPEGRKPFGWFEHLSLYNCSLPIPIIIIYFVFGVLILRVFSWFI